ncbi:Sulfotransferase domain protein [Planctomycetes bacterium Poly30]|uniref:Sulfotransferase domain protein n=1 Tax=Saltatorellus ferox TaxID=2528018 RepID=A0A518ESB4_9BACT|nr:Sulfotransferase domain protein [Planctomycetes bacterium Poly30]
MAPVFESRLSASAVRPSSWLQRSFRFASDRAWLVLRPGRSEARELARCSLELETARAALEGEDGVAAEARNVVICGCPRSGTSLLAAMLHQPPRMMTAMEPWEGLRFPPHEVFRWLRTEWAGGRLPSTRLDVRLLEAEARVAWTREARSYRVTPANPGAPVGLKWPCYWQLLGSSKSLKFLVCVRDPASVVSSMGRQPGRLRMGLDHDVPFNHDLHRRLLQSASTEEQRRVAHYDEVYERVLRHAQDSNVMLVRYERWFEDPADLLEEISTFLGADLAHPRVRLRGGAEPHLAPGGSPAMELRGMSRTANRLGYPSTSAGSVRGDR